MTADRKPIGSTRRLSVGRRIGSVAVGLLIPVGAWLGVAAADEWGDSESNPIDGTGPHPDGGDHNYCFQPMDDSAIDNIISSENALNDTTDAMVWFETSCDYNIGAETDVVWDTVDLSGDKRGTSYCNDWDSNEHCDQIYVELDVAKLNEGTNDEMDTTKTACHELGHSVGLTHHSSGYGCMILGEVPSTDLQWRRYVAHHKGDHINDWF